MTKLQIKKQDDDRSSMHKLSNQRLYPLRTASSLQDTQHLF